VIFICDTILHQPDALKGVSIAFNPFLQHGEINVAVKQSVDTRLNRYTVVSAPYALHDRFILGSNTSAVINSSNRMNHRRKSYCELARALALAN